MALKKLSLADIQSIAEEAAEQGPDYNEAASQGEYQPPAEGVARLRLVGYIETGVHTTGAGSKFGPKTKPRATLVFELSGKNHAPVERDGKLYPHTIAINLAISQHQKAVYSKLFKTMVQDFPGRKNFAQLLGEAWIGTISHRKFKRADGSEGKVAELKNDNGFTIRSTTFEDPETGDTKKIKVDPPVSDLRLFLFNFASLDQWDSLFIDGTYDNGDSKNKFQEAIKSAENFQGSPIYELLVEAGRDEELIPAPKGKDEDGEDDEEQEAPAKAHKRAQEAPEEEVEGEVAPTPEKPVAARKSAPAGKPAPKAKAKAKPAPVEEEDEDDDPIAGL